MNALWKTPERGRGPLSGVFLCFMRIVYSTVSFHALRYTHVSSGSDGSAERVHPTIETYSFIESAEIQVQVSL